MPLAPAIAGSSVGAYFAPMLAALLRLLTVAALTLMPFGMGAASAGAAHHEPIAASSGHCDDQGGQPFQEWPVSLAGCSAGCSTFMTEHAPVEEPIMAVRQLAVSPVTRRWSSLSPETATPPPKRA